MAPKPPQEESFLISSGWCLTFATFLLLTGQGCCPAEQGLEGGAAPGCFLGKALGEFRNVEDLWIYSAINMGFTMIYNNSVDCIIKHLDLWRSSRWFNWPNLWLMKSHIEYSAIKFSQTIWTNLPKVRISG